MLSEVPAVLGRWTLGYLEKKIQTPMAQGGSTKIIRMIKWIRIKRLSTKNCFSARGARQTIEKGLAAFGATPQGWLQGYLAHKNPLPPPP